MSSYQYFVCYKSIKKIENTVLLIICKKKLMKFLREQSLTQNFGKDLCVSD